ncbi:MAG: hypothetical protein AAF490_14000 [Chloroflexota bacterium]
MSEIDNLRKKRDGYTVFDAGLPRFPRNFTRDGILAALLFEDAVMMRDQVRFCALHQGQKPNPISGEEIGKIFHEFPGFPLRARNTQFNGCDTTGLWLYGLAKYVEWSGDKSILDELKTAVSQAITYTQTHLREDYLFEESPSYCGADRFALKVTYWKDSVLYGRPNGETAWPAVFTLAHVQTLAGVRAIGQVLNSTVILELASKMHQALDSLWDDSLGCYISAMDRLGRMPILTSDTLHMLAYLQPGDISSNQLAKIAETVTNLESELGYLVMSGHDAASLQYDYHAKTVWPFEQGLIHLGAVKFGLPHIAKICERVVPHIQTSASETLAVSNDLNSPSCDPQLWTLAARSYFSKNLS